MKTIYKAAVLFLVVSVVLILLVLDFWRLQGVVLLCPVGLLTGWDE